MKVIFTKIASIVLALLVLFSTFSFAVEKHYCGEFLVDVSYLGNAAGCGMEMGKTTKKNCCKDETKHIEGQDELQQVVKEDFTFSEQLFLASFVISYQDLFIENRSKNLFFKDASPPDIPKDYQVLYQTFLI